MAEERHDGRRSRFIRYLGELVQLRVAVEHNMSDFETSDQIIYLADSNVVHLFLNPFKNWNNVSPFKTILDQRRPELGTAAAVITAEYIFSRELAGKQGYPTFIAAEHVEEIVDYFRRAEEDQASRQQAGKRDSSENPEDDDDSNAEHLTSALDEMRRQLSLGSNDPEELRRLFHKRIPQLISQLDQDALLPRQQFARLQRDDLIRPFHLAPHIDRRCLSRFPPNEIELWRSALEAFAHYGSEGEISERGPPRDLIVNRDATVLTQLFSVNDDLIKRKVPAKVVFVTEDEKIHYAVAYREKYKHYNGENFLRRPIQYLPTLNFQEMPNIISTSNSTSEIRSIIDSVLGLKADITRSFLHDLIHRLAVALKQEYGSKPEANLPAWKAALQQAWDKTVRDSFKVQYAPRIEQGQRRVKQAWDRISNNAVSLNVELLARRLQQMGQLAEELKASADKNDLANAFKAYQAEQLDVLERQHIVWCLEWLIADPDRENSSYTPRGPLLVRQDRLGIRGEHTVEAAIEQIARLKTDKQNGSTISLKSILHRYELPDLMMIVAIVAYRNSAWAQARDFGDRALIHLRKMFERTGKEEESRVQDSIAELRYLVAVCKRFELSELDAEQHRTERERNALRRKFDSADKAHCAALEYAEIAFDFFASARANAERATLHLTGLAIDSIHPELKIIERERARFPIQATEWLRRASNDLDTHYPKEIRRSGSLENALYFKANMNLVSVFSYFGMERLPSMPPAGLITSALKNAIGQLRANPTKFPPHLQLECHICEWMLLEEGAAKGKRTREILSELDEVLSGSVKSLTRLDQEELERYRRFLTNSKPVLPARSSVRA